MSPVKYEHILVRDKKNLPETGLIINYPVRGDIPENRYNVFLLGNDPQNKIKVSGSGSVEITNAITGKPIDFFTFDQQDNPIVIRNSQTGQVLTLNYQPEPAPPTLQLTPQEIESLKNYK